MTARLVCDGSGVVHVPPEMGTPRLDQMQGTVLEQQCELAGRVCYDSLGKGRSSADFHEHIREVGHTSIWEHAVVTLAFGVNVVDPWELVNRKGVNVFGLLRPNRIVISANLRAVAEWGDKPTVMTSPGFRSVGPTFRWFAEKIYAPQILGGQQCHPVEIMGIQFDKLNIDVPEHQPVTLYLSGSRGFSHEMVRHRYAVSQRSTRYCDESETPWVWHPEFEEIDMRVICNGVMKQSRFAYKTAVERIENALAKKGVDKASARKRARGAARGFLGHALQTEMLFTATSLEWQGIFRQRLSPAADPEIAGVMEEARDVLRRSRVGGCFE